jgi:hypothetical protein
MPRAVQTPRHIFGSPTRFVCKVVVSGAEKEVGHCVAKRLFRVHTVGGCDDEPSFRDETWSRVCLSENMSIAKIGMINASLLRQV